MTAERRLGRGRDRLREACIQLDEVVFVTVIVAWVNQAAVKRFRELDKE